MYYTLHLAVDPALHTLYTAAAIKYTDTPMSDRNSGFDLFNETDLQVSDFALLKFGVVAACATSTQDTAAYWLCPRSSMSKTGLICANSQGLIDKGYRGPIMGAVRSLTGFVSVVREERLFQLVAGDAQPWANVIIYENANQLPVPMTVRGAGGFGSTGH
jgi:dUTPase